ncbi:hypothetical protein [Bacillus sp. LB(2018)]|uniref:hypothetical protein n=1 Tax=Bacillus sp. LB(2018) TaxID=2293324 RepID=UPI000E2F6F55|nr:hypothetical protein DZB85_01830 [Bacillus sp. LB(2018)]
MGLNHTSILLDRLDSGDLQNLAVELLTRENTDWEKMSQSGIVEGSRKTRKGTPDAWCKTKGGATVYIQATGDKAKGKMLGDLEKSIKKLDELNQTSGAFCIAFLSYDPQPEEVSQCESLCKQKNCTFQFYNNTEISTLLDSKYQDLRKGYLGITMLYNTEDSKRKMFSRTNKKGIEARTCANFIQKLDWGKLTSEEFTDTLTDVNYLYDILSKINPTSLSFFCTLIEMAEPDKYNEYIMEIPFTEVENELSLDGFTILNQVSVLEKYGISRITEDEQPVLILVMPGDVTWRLLADIKYYAEMVEVPLSNIFVNLDFSLLDEV